MKHICLVLCIALCVLLSACNPGGQKPDTYDSVYYAQYTGLSEDMTTPDGAVYRVYVPESFYAWSPAAIIMVPDGMSAADFADSDLGKSWRSAADNNGFALGFIEGENKTWNTTGDPSGRDEVKTLEDVYNAMKSKLKSVQLPFIMNKESVTLVGYEEGGEAALAVAAGTPATFCAVIAIDAEAPDVKNIENLGKQFCYPFPGDGFGFKEEVGLVANTLQMPAWFINCGSNDAIDYYRGINNTAGYKNNSFASVEFDPANDVAEIWITSDGSDITPEDMWIEFICKHTRPLGKAGGELSWAVDFTDRSGRKGYIETVETFDGLERRYLTYVPESYNGSEAYPLVFVLHGYTGTNFGIAEESRWSDVAEKYGIIVVFPQAYPNPEANPYNIACPSWINPILWNRPGADDDAFITHVIEATAEEYNIDKTRIYATAHSNGSAMIEAYATMHPETFAAIAPIGWAAAGLAESIDNYLPMSLYYGEYDSSVADTNVAEADDYWTELNGLGSVSPTTSTDYDGLFTTTSYNKGNVPIVQFTEVTDSPHSYFPEESWKIWEDFFSHFSRVDGKTYYDGKLVE